MSYRLTATFVAAALVLGSAQAQLWRSPQETMKHPYVKGYKVSGLVMTKGNEKITMDTLGGTVVGYTIETTKPETLAQVTMLALGVNEQAQRAYHQFFLNPYTVKKAREGTIIEFEDGATVIGMKINKQGKWSLYVGPKVHEKSAFPNTQNFFGSKQAPVEVRIFSEFQCPYCKTFWDNHMKRWISKPQQYLVFHHHYILPSHQNAPLAAQASECASQQKLFWPYADFLFRSTKEWSRQSTQEARSKFIDSAKGMKLDVKKFETCLKSTAVEKDIKQQTIIGNKLGVPGTPTMFINGVIVYDYNDTEYFKAIVSATTGKNDLATLVKRRLEVYGSPLARK